MTKHLYLIWSFKRNSWWAWDRQGYTPVLDEAGRYTAEEAGDIATRSVFLESVPVWEGVAIQHGAPTCYPYQGKVDLPR